MSKISELSDGGSLVSSDYLIAVRSGGNVKVRMDQINVDQVDLGDNEFIRLGNSQDLTMVHTSTQSIINQAGIGDLLIQKAGATKLTINASGIDVTGSVTADGLTSDGNVSVVGAGNTRTIGFNFYGSSKYNFHVDGATDADKMFVRRGTTNVADFASNGDISFYNTAGNSQALVWDASAESLGIGTSTPLSKMSLEGGHIYVGDLTGSAGTQEVLSGYRERSGTTTYGNISIRSTYDTGSNASDMLFYTASGGTNTAEAMRIDALGNVGIGVVPSAWGGSSNALQVGVYAGLSRNDALGAGDLSYNAYMTTAASDSWSRMLTNAATRIHQRDGSIQFKYAASAAAGTAITWSESMRIDVSGNLLVGKTTTSSGVVGHRFNPDGSQESTTNGGLVAYFNRKTSDGEIVRFDKDGAAVGSIGSTGGNLQFMSGSVGVGVGGDNLYPTNGSGNSTDAALDIGDSSARFKDLYLSGGVYLGGTGAANKLDDYETGSFTPTVYGSTTAGTATYTIQTGFYEKIGRLVHFQLYLDWSGFNGTGELLVVGLPFSSSSDSNMYTAISSYVSDVALTANNVAQGFLVNQGDTSITCKEAPVGGGAASGIAVDGAGTMLLSGTYRSV